MVGGTHLVALLGRYRGRQLVPEIETLASGLKVGEDGHRGPGAVVRRAHCGPVEEVVGQGSLGARSHRL